MALAERVVMMEIGLEILLRILVGGPCYHEFEGISWAEGITVVDNRQ